MSFHSDDENSDDERKRYIIDSDDERDDEKEIKSRLVHRRVQSPLSSREIIIKELYDSGLPKDKILGRLLESYTGPVLELTSPSYIILDAIYNSQYGYMLDIERLIDHYKLSEDYLDEFPPKLSPDTIFPLPPRLRRDDFENE